MFKTIGYKEEKIEVRVLTIAKLKLEIINYYRRHGDRKIKVIDIISGETALFYNTDCVFDNKWNDLCEIELVNLPHMYGDEIIIIIRER